ncbi:MAG TPA: thiamine pyrophosphate-binding protein, partial [Chloroflexota bacterium]|nr:thiamine pyrophosphate-binding protein [Chloroflexota bacterium]
MKVYEALAQAFAAEGVTAIFGMMGDGNMYWMTALEKHPSIQVYEARFEGAALAMADGWARATGQPGVCAVTCGPGITQLGTSLLVARRANTPLVVFAGDSPSADEEYVQRMDQQAFAAGSEAGFVRLLAANQAYDAVRTAFYRARVEARPIVLDAPMDIQQQTFDVDEPYQPSTSLLPPTRVQPDADRLRQAVELVAQSQRPVIVAGRGAMLAGAKAAVLALGDRVGALLVTSLMAKNWLADAEWNAGISGLYATRAASELLTEADCVIGIGASLNHYTTEHGYMYPDARYVQIDIQPHLRMFAGRGADVYLQADARSGAEALERALAQRG